jgi:hypothetical protein
MSIWVKILDIPRIVKWLMIRSNGGMLGFTIGNPKYLGGPRSLKGLGGLSGFELLPLRSNG